MMTKCNILLVEDQYKDRNALSKILNDMGCNVDVVCENLKAYEKLKANNYHIVLTNYEAPQIDGLDLLNRVKEQSSDTPVIIISNPCPPEIAIKAMKYGAHDFLLKPLEQTVIESVISNIMGQLQPQEEYQPTKKNEHLIVTENDQLLRLLELAKTVADSKAPVLIQGESGTGKELFARYIHKHSSRASKPFIALNCAALPDGLLESELFGHEKGAFTGAISRKLGRFELAQDGSILLDEISEMNLYLQAKLLRVLQESEIDRVGGQQTISIDVRVIATTNRDIEATVKDEKFRSDLFYRLNVIPLKIPPLRERKSDITVLTSHFIKKYNKIDGRNVKGISNEALSTIQNMSFPGNVRELENIIERAILLCNGITIEKKDLFIGEEHKLPSGENSDFIPTGTLRDMERKMIFQTLTRTKGNRTHAADILGISVRTLRNKLNEYKMSNYEG